MKQFLIGLFGLLFVALMASAFALTVEVDGTTTEPVSVKIGERIPVVTTFSFTSDYEDVTVRIELSYGHGKEVRAKTDPVDVIAGTTYNEKLYLTIPNDIEVSLPGETYTLSVDIKDGKGRTIDSEVFDLMVQKENDLLEIQKVIKTTATAGKSTLVTVVVKNIGSDRQEDIYVKIRVPLLDITVEERVGDLEVNDTDEREDTSAIDIPLRIPKDAADGTYDLEIVAYNKNTEIRQIDSLKVKGIIAEPAKIEILPQVITQDIEQGESKIYTITLANLESKAQTYTVSVRGTEGWALAQIDSPIVTVEGKSTKTVNVQITTNLNAALGQHIFEVKFKSDGAEKEIELMTSVTEEAKVSGLMILVITLAIIAVVLIIIFIATRKPVEEIPTEEEKGYY